MSLTCSECDRISEPVWAHYAARATIEERTGTATFRLPLHRCAEGHVEGWRTGDDFFFDLAAAPTVDHDGLLASAVPPRSRFLRRLQCGNCEEPLDLAETGRATGMVDLAIPDQPAPARFEVDLPRMSCRVCGVQVAPSRRLVNTAADLGSWLFQLIADAMPPERAEAFVPRQ